MKAVGFSACPSDAVLKVKRNSELVLQTKGGSGRVREFIDFYLLDEPWKTVKGHDFQPCPFINYDSKLASNEIGTALKAFEIGQPFLAPSAAFIKSSSDIPVTLPFTINLISLIAKPSPSLSNVTSALALISSRSMTCLGYH